MNFICWPSHAGSIILNRFLVGHLPLNMPTFCPIFMVCFWGAVQNSPSKWLTLSYVIVHLSTPAFIWLSLYIWISSKIIVTDTSQDIVNSTVSYTGSRCTNLTWLFRRSLIYLRALNMRRSCSNERSSHQLVPISLGKHWPMKRANGLNFAWLVGFQRGAEFESKDVIGCAFN